MLTAIVPAFAVFGGGAAERLPGQERGIEQVEELDIAFLRLYDLGACSTLALTNPPEPAGKTHLPLGVVYYRQLLSIKKGNAKAIAEAL